MSKNTKPFNYVSSNGTKFAADRSDFVEGVSVHVRKNLSLPELMNDVAEVTAWHLQQVLPELNPFNGYANIDFKITTT